jgi:hypothetical protein
MEMRTAYKNFMLKIPQGKKQLATPIHKCCNNIETNLTVLLVYGSALDANGSRTVSRNELSVLDANSGRNSESFYTL